MRHGKTQLLSFLLKRKGLDINAQNCSGRTALHLAAHTLREEIVDMLQEAGADANILDCCGDAPMHLACKVSLPPQNKQHLLAVFSSPRKNLISGRIAPHPALLIAKLPLPRPRLPGRTGEHSPALRRQIREPGRDELPHRRMRSGRQRQEPPHGDAPTPRQRSAQDV